MNKRTYQIGNSVGLIALFCVYAAASGNAAPPQEAQTPKPRATASPAVPGDAVGAARQALEAVQARIVAGVASGAELEDAQDALRVAVANARLSDARAARERQKVQVAAGVCSVSTLAESELTVTEREVALLQAQTDHLERVAARLNTQVAAGVLSGTEVDAATIKRDVARTQLAAAKARYTSQKLAVLKTRLEAQQERQRAGIAPQSDVDKARADYENALAAALKSK